MHRYLLAVFLCSPIAAATEPIYLDCKIGLKDMETEFSLSLIETTREITMFGDLASQLSTESGIRPTTKKGFFGAKEITVIYDLTPKTTVLNHNYHMNINRRTLAISLSLIATTTTSHSNGGNRSIRSSEELKKLAGTCSVTNIVGRKI